MRALRGQIVHCIFLFFGFFLGSLLLTQQTWSMGILAGHCQDVTLWTFQGPSCRHRISPYWTDVDLSWRKVIKFRSYSFFVWERNSRVTWYYKMASGQMIKGVDTCPLLDTCLNLAMSSKIFHWTQALPMINKKKTTLFFSKKNRCANLGGYQSGIVGSNYSSLWKKFEATLFCWPQ